MAATVSPEQSRVLEMCRGPGGYGYFLTKILGCRIFPKQAAAAEAVRTQERVSIVGANGTGKDFLTGRLIAAWMATHYPAKVVVTGPTFRQVQDIIWNELRAGHKTARRPLGGRMMDTPSWRIDESTFATGLSTDNPYSLQGYHSPNLLVVVTEAHAVDDDTITALRRLNPRTFVMTGNPFTTSGTFYRSHHDQAHLYSTHSFSAFDTPNLLEEAPFEGWPELPGMVSKKDVKQRLDEWGLENPLYIGGVVGLFPENLDQMTVVPPGALKLASQRMRPALGAKILGVDIADTGEDKTVWVLRQGLVAQIVNRYQGITTDVTETRLQGWCRDNKPDVIVVDATGLGTGVYNHMRTNRSLYGGARIVAFKGGSSPRDKNNYKDLNAECWFAVRKWIMEEDGCIPYDEPLMGQLAGRHYETNGKTINLESKKNMAHSPDEADALAMTFGVSSGKVPLWTG